MKRYKMNEMLYSGTGAKWRYIGRANTIEEAKAKFEYYHDMYRRAKAKGKDVGFRITDTETNEIVFEHIF